MAVVAPKITLISLRSNGGVVEISALNILASIAFLMLIAISGGILYLTLAEWRDRRRQDKEKRSR